MPNDECSICGDLTDWCHAHPDREAAAHTERSPMPPTTAEVSHAR